MCDANVNVTFILHIYFWTIPIDNSVKKMFMIWQGVNFVFTITPV